MVRASPMLAGLAAAAFAVACGADGGGGANRNTATAVLTPTPVQVVTVGEAQNGAALSVHTGEQVVVTLSSTYWAIAGSTNPAVLRSAGGPVIRPSPGCIPGMGCGTVTAAFTAVGAGSAVLTASRTTCGEALRCTGTAGVFSVTVTVSG
jgi:hypothetical protein